jgi:hypothetical protein
MALWSLFGRDCPRGLFVSWALVGKSRSLDFASASLRESDAALGMTIFLGMTVFCGDRVSRVMEFKN